MNPQDIEDLRQLIEFLKSYGVAEFDLDRGDLKIRLKFDLQQAPATGFSELARILGSTVPPATGGTVPVAAAPVAAPVAAAATATAPAADPEAGLHVVKSPIVGTFYASPAPGAAAFVAPGDRVEKGQVIGIVEAMKLMNEIEADAAGEIVKCLVSNGQAIEYGQPLFAMRTA